MLRDPDESDVSDGDESVLRLRVARIEVVGASSENERCGGNVDETHVWGVGGADDMLVVDSVTARVR